MLRPLNGLFKPEDYPALLVGLANPDDAAVYQLDEARAIISTTDFFPPVVDDPYDFGAIAAANALSDIYAMGGEPLMAINLVAWPDGHDLAVLSEILRGGAEKVRESGAVIAGGHTVTDNEPKYGLAVTGQVHPGRIATKGGAQPGDVLLLTKPLGAGVVTTALKQGRARAEDVRVAVASMSRLNRDASRLAMQFDVRAMTDITGYSLLGHAHEMAHLGAVDFVIDFDALEWLPGAFAYAQQGIAPGGTGRNRDYFGQWVRATRALTDWQENLLYDPQTSGGLLIAISADRAEGLQTAMREAGVAAHRVGEVAAPEQAGGGWLVVR